MTFKLYIFIRKVIGKVGFEIMITYTIKELEPILKRKSKTIKKYIKDGELEAIKIGKGYIVEEESIKEFLKNFKVSNN